MNKRKLFSQKIVYLYDSLEIKEDEFVKLFWNGAKPSFSVRKKTVIGKWYEGDIDQAKAFYFDTYPISRVHQNGKFFFTKQDFLDNTFEEFKQKVDRYIAHIKRPKNSFEYKYIYYYDIHLKVVAFVQIYTIDKIDSSYYKIRIIPSNIYKDIDIEPYYGELRIINDYYYISVKNSFEILTFYFMLNKGFKNNTAIYGLRLGLSYDKGLPISGKNLLSKKILSEEEESFFYLNASENDTLISDESIDDIFSSIKDNHIKKLCNKINNLTIFAKTAQKNLKTIDQDIYLAFFYNRITILNEVAKKVKNNRTFFYNARRRSIQKIFFNILGLSAQNSCRFVYPIFANDAILFDSEENRDSQQTIEQLITLANSGIKVDLILVARLSDKLSNTTINIIKKLLDNKIDIKIAPKEHIINSVRNFDFIYSKSQQIAVYHPMGDRICYFRITNSADTILNLSYDFEKIKKHSYTLEEFLDKKNIILNKKLQHLVGTWYAYSYGSIEVESKPKIWMIKYVIDAHKNIEAFIDNRLAYRGYIKIGDSKKSHIVLTSLHSSNQSFIIFHNKDIYKKIFKTTMIYNQFSTEQDMITFGILSRIKLDLDTVRETLGRTDTVSLKEGRDFEERVKNLYLQQEF